MLKRTRDRLFKTGLGALSVATVFGLTAAVLVFAYSDRAQRNAERQQAASAQADETNLAGECVALLSPEEIVACVRQDREATYDQRHTQSDLRAQHDMAAFAHGLLLFGALSFITSVGGLAALVWTFRETRKMTRSQESAYVELADITFRTHGTYGANISFNLTNHGRTPAKDISFSGNLHIHAGDFPVVYPVGADLNVLPGGATRPANGRIADFTDHFSDVLGDYKQSGSHGRNTLTTISESDGPPDPSIRLVGNIVWHTVYGDPETIAVDNRAELHFDGDPLWINSHFRDPKHE